MPKICYVPKNFGTRSRDHIDMVNSVITDYKAQGYSLTLRQVYYQMVARAIIENTERSYKNLGNLISDGRLAGLIDWDAIEDRTRNLKGRSSWETPGDIIESAAYSYHIDYWDNQPNYVEVWVEKEALAGVIGKICHTLDVNYFSCRGYVSQLEMWSAAQRLVNRQELGQQVILLHLGDHDPSGIDMSRDILERNVLFKNSELEFKRLALNMDQVEHYNPPPNPAKITDSRAKGYIARFGRSSWELDALEPRVISDLIETNVLKYRDEEKYQKTKEREEEEKRFLKDFAESWGPVAENWQGIKEEYC